MAEAKKAPEFEIIIKLRQADWGGPGRDPDPNRDLFSVWVKNHPICPPGKDYRVAYTGPKVVEDGVQVLGNICWLFDPNNPKPGKKTLHRADLMRIKEYVQEWQANPQMMDASRANQEPIL